MKKCIFIEWIKFKEAFNKMHPGLNRFFRFYIQTPQWYISLFTFSQKLKLFFRPVSIIWSFLRLANYIDFKIESKLSL